MKLTKIAKYASMVILLTLFTGCGKTQPPSSASTPTPTTVNVQGKDFTFTPGYQLYPPQKGDTIAIIKTSMGDIKIKLFPEKVPKAVENFTVHAKEGYYDNLTFHRIINDFMIQGGDPLGDGTGGESIWGKPFEDEFSLDLFNYRGALSMANSGKDTNGSQFFIVQNKNMSKETLDSMKQAGFPFTDEIIKNYEAGGAPWLDFKHTVFGQVYEGMDVVDKIAAVKVTDEKTNKPVEDVVIKTIEIKTFGE